MRQTIFSGLIAIATLAVASLGWAGALKVDPGMWKTSMTLHHGATAALPQIRTHCVTQKDIDDFANGLMLKSENFPAESCQRTSFHESASEVDWKYECTGRATITREGSIKFDTTSHYTGTLKMTGTMMGTNMLNTVIDESSVMEGTRIGACTGKEGGAQPTPPPAH
jgi:hypothetical protein